MCLRWLIKSLVLVALCEGSSDTSLRGSPDLTAVAPRIINGVNADEGRYPYFVMLLGSGMCGGVLIGPDLVLTAAHCDRISSTVRIGVYDRMRMGDAERLLIVDEVVHPEYTTSSFRFDAMLMKLRIPSTRPFIKILNDNDSTPGAIDELTVIGFGDTVVGNGVRIPNIMQETQLDYVDNERCRDMHGNYIIQDDMLCAYRNNTDSCFGDSGGPLLIKGQGPDDDVLVGTVSWGRDCAAQNYAGVYARTSYFYDWISQASCHLSPELAPFDCVSITDATTPSSAPTSEPTTAPSMAPTRPPTDNTATFLGWSPDTTVQKLRRCEGDCDSDEDCEEGLVCYQRNGWSVPGCDGRRERTIADYCIRLEDAPP